MWYTVGSALLAQFYIYSDADLYWDTVVIYHFNQSCLNAATRWKFMILNDWILVININLQYCAKVPSPPSIAQQKKNTREHYQSWIGLPNSQISILLKQHRITLTHDPHPKDSFGMFIKTPRERFLKNNKRACLREFRLCWRITVVRLNIDF